MNNTFFNSIELLQLVKKWKKHLIIVGVISLLGSIIFSSPYFIKPKYKSFALIYPSNLIAYSTESPTEQMLQLAQSYDIRNKIIASFNLYKHFDLDTTKVKSYLSKIYQLYEENIIIKKTERLGCDSRIIIMCSNGLAQIKFGPGRIRRRLV